MKQTIAILSAVVVLAGCSSPKRPSNMLANQQDRNAAVLQAKVLTTAAFTKLLAGEPLNDEDRGNAERAVPIVKQVIQISPNQPAYEVLLARCYWVMGKKEDAQKELQNAIELDTKYKTGEPALMAEAHHDLANLLIGDGKWDEAGKELDKSLDLFPTDPRYLTTKASVLMQQKDVEGARKLAAQALKADPQNSLALSMLKMIQDSEKQPPVKAGS